MAAAHQSERIKPTKNILDDDDSYEELSHSLPVVEQNEDEGDLDCID